MKVIGKVKSWNVKKEKDCFGLPKPSNIDHIYPRSKGGSDGSINKQKLSEVANDQKRDLTKGKIGKEWRFSIIKQLNKEGLVFGIMYIRHKDWESQDWKEVEPVK